MKYQPVFQQLPGKKEKVLLSVVVFEFIEHCHLVPGRVSTRVQSL